MLFPPMTPYNPASVRIRGGTINGAVIGGTTPAAGTFTTLTDTGLLDISGAAAGQIKFPATQNASADANTLDDYEEGTWSPTIRGDSVAGTQTYSTQTGRYTKIGRLVMVEATIIMSAKDAATAGNLQVGGFPFSEGGGAFGGIVVGYYSNINLDAGFSQLGIIFNGTGTNAYLVESGDNVNASFLAAATIGNTPSLLIGGCYSV